MPFSIRQLPLLLCLLSVSILGATGIAHCGKYAGTGIVGSPHDFGSELHNPCEVCHIMHHAQPGTPLFSPVLWMDVISGPANFKPYRSATFDSIKENIDPLVGDTIMCLTCHDGAIAPEMNIANTPRVQSDGISGIAVGKDQDLRNDHPLGLDYIDFSSRQNSFLRPASTEWFDGKPGRRIVDSLKEGKYLTCGTCHDMHNKNNVADAANSYNYLVYSRQKNSSLCRTCHEK